MGSKTVMMLLIATVVINITACNNNAATSPAAHIQSPAKPAPEADPPGVSMAEGFRPGSGLTAPLTGLPETRENSDRVIAVMVNNHSKARPQSGLDKADMVYELLEEGLITRFMAFYQSEAPRVVGPVRSVRPYNVDISNGFDAIISHAGGSVEALGMLRSGGRSSDMDEIYSYPKAYWRDSSRKAPHNLYTSVEKLRRGALKKGYKLDGTAPAFPFMNETDQVQGQTASTITVHYSKQNTAGYVYDPEKKLYMRWTAGKPHLDRETGKQLSAVNVLVVGAQHRIIDSEGRLEIDINGPGDGYLFQHGKVMKITWERRDGAIRAYRSGKEMPLYPGHTWVNVVPNQPTLTAHLLFH
ncbi:DUF3048 domain-containing protein [Aneurinibacillus terranovensis]|uniref:DUF3048 domain-containing protein n=1 Tax=Aneurinibacillus terranovensis TaxID=278991 RepID=UPI00041A589E|nr:DUF3048 domain-containing protein [Aneurinibacillus terranovensis]